MVNDMSKRQKKVPIKFTVPDQYDIFMSHTYQLGFVTTEQAHQIINKFHSNKPAPNACIQGASIAFEEWVHFGPHNTKHFTSLNISGMFYPDKMPQCAKCIPSDTAKVNCCARNLRSGKCQDQFIKQTLGAILFPQHYGKRK